jgi:hypothetical protein
MATSGAVEGAPKLLLKLEGLAVFVVCLVFYARGRDGWMLFVALFLAPDLSILGYLVGPGAGASAYNTAHTYVVAAALTLLGVFAWPPLVPVSLIWAAHIGLDRALGFGLKYPSAFADTHLGSLKRAEHAR